MVSSIIFWLIAAYGMSTILVYGSIFKQPRAWIHKHSSFFGGLISCMLCLSTWVGFFFSLTLGSLSSKFFNAPVGLNVLIDGCFTAGGVWAINSIIEFFEENRIK